MPRWGREGTCRVGNSLRLGGGLRKSPALVTFLESLNLGLPDTRASAMIDHLGALHTRESHVPVGFVSSEVCTLLCGPPWLPWILVATRQSRVSGLKGFAGFRTSVQLQPFRRFPLINTAPEGTTGCQGEELAELFPGTTSARWPDNRPVSTGVGCPYSGVPWMHPRVSPKL